MGELVDDFGESVQDYSDNVRDSIDSTLKGWAVGVQNYSDSVRDNIDARFKTNTSNLVTSSISAVKSGVQQAEDAGIIPSQTTVVGTAVFAIVGLILILLVLGKFEAL